MEDQMNAPIPPKLTYSIKGYGYDEASGTYLHHPLSFNKHVYVMKSPKPEEDSYFLIYLKEENSTYQSFQWRLTCVSNLEESNCQSANKESERYGSGLNSVYTSDLYGKKENLEFFYS